VDSPRSAVRELDSRSAPDIGRHGRLELVFEPRRGRTVLAHSYAEPPLRIGRVHDLGGAAYVILVCSGPGIFGGDTYKYCVHAASGARVVLTSQSAMQAHPALVPSCPPALIQQEYVVADDAELHCDWDPLIPFAGARLDQRFDLRVAPGGRLYWGDAMMAGRVSRGEAWRFDTLSHELALRTGGRLSYLERYTIVPAEHRTERAWIAGGARYAATTLVQHPDASADIAEAWQHEAAASDRHTVQVAVDAAAPGLIVARFLSADGAPFARARASYRAAALRDIFRRPELAARK